jgi:hypothetical protein
VKPKNSTEKRILKLSDIGFQLPAVDMLLIEKIVDRCRGMRIYRPREWLMIKRDLVAVHSNGCPLRLADLLAADWLAFGLDLDGIRKNLNRQTGKLEHFQPHFRAVWPPKAAPSADGSAIPKAASSGGWGNEFPKTAPADNGWGNVWPAALVR